MLQRLARRATAPRAAGSAPRRGLSAGVGVPLHAQELPSIRDGSYAERPLPPLVIMHGLLGSLSNFRRIAANPQLGANRRVFLLDLRNHGASPHDPSMRLEDLAADVVRFLDDRGLEKATLMGHSLGGRAAMTAALEHPDRVAELAVIDMAPVVYPQEFTYRKRWDSIPNIMAQMDALDLSAVRTREDADAALAEAIPDRGVRAFALQNLKADRTQKPPVWSWRLALPHLRNGVDHMFSFEAAKRPAFQGRTLFLNGGKSKYVTSEHHAEIHRLFPRAEIVSIPKAGHWVHAEAPAAFVSHVGRFLNGGARQ